MAFRRRRRSFGRRRFGRRKRRVSLRRRIGIRL